MGEMDEIVKEFLVESQENLDKLDRDFVTLETTPDDREKLASIFRVIHTIKGTCGFLGFSKLEKVTHVGENLLSKLRDGVLRLNPETTDGLLAMVDVVRKMLSAIEQSGNDGQEAYPELIARLTELKDREPGQSAAAPIPTPPQEEVIAPEVIAEKEILPPPQEVVAPDIHVPAIAMKNEPEKTDAPKGESVSDSSIRVDVNLLDKLMNLVGELVLTRNQIVQFTNSSDANLFTASQRLNLITSELQGGVMKTRMQPIGNVWNKFPRVVRDLSHSLGKKIRVDMEGKETECDKSLLEAIKDPLTHIIRNSVDHGVEGPDVRKAKGKSEEGRILLRAYHEGGQVNIEIVDDGNGIDPERVKKKALEKGLITSEQLARMSERDIINLIILPGFSTAEKVTNVSGRGVGMDVVKTNIEKIGGSFEIQSRLGEGTTLKIKIPLTLAIIPALIVTASGDRYAIPQVTLQELVLLEGDKARTGIENIQGAPVYRLRGKLLPLLYLDGQLGMNQGKLARALMNDVVNIIVLQASDMEFGLVVDAINDTQEIVVKPLGNLLKGIPVFSGATIMGDGRVALILDVVGLAQNASLVSDIRESSLAERLAESTKQASLKQQLLLFETPDQGWGAIQLSAIARLEEFGKCDIEHAGETDVIQYRGQIMPLIPLSRVLPERRLVPRNAEGFEPVERDKVDVIVYRSEEQYIGLMVDRIVDIVEESIELQRPGTRDGIMGSLVIRNKVVELLDIAKILMMACPEFFETLKVANSGE